MLDRNCEKWGDKVKIVGISNDSEVDPVLECVKSKGWSKINHFHRGEQDFYKINPLERICFVFLVDANGKLAYLGHPDDINFEDSIEKLLKGEALSESEFNILS